MEHIKLEDNTKVFVPKRFKKEYLRLQSLSNQAREELNTILKKVNSEENEVNAAEKKAKNASEEFKTYRIIFEGYKKEAKEQPELHKAKAKYGRFIRDGKITKSKKIIDNVTIGFLATVIAYSAAVIAFSILTGGAAAPLLIGLSAFNILLATTDIALFNEVKKQDRNTESEIQTEKTNLEKKKNRENEIEITNNPNENVTPVNDVASEVDQVTKDYYDVIDEIDQMERAKNNLKKYSGTDKRVLNTLDNNLKRANAKLQKIGDDYMKLKGTTEHLEPIDEKVAKKIEKEIKELNEINNYEPKYEYSQSEDSETENGKIQENTGPFNYKQSSTIVETEHSTTSEELLVDAKEEEKYQQVNEEVKEQDDVVVVDEMDNQQSIRDAINSYEAQKTENKEFKVARGKDAVVDEMKSPDFIVKAANLWSNNQAGKNDFLNRESLTKAVESSNNLGQEEGNNVTSHQNDAEHVYFNPDDDQETVNSDSSQSYTSSAFDSSEGDSAQTQNTNNSNNASASSNHSEKTGKKSFEKSMITTMQTKKSLFGRMFNRKKTNTPNQKPSKRGKHPKYKK